MAKSFRPVLREQPMLLPVDMRQWLPPDHLVWCVLEIVDAVDTSALERTRRRGGAGAAGFDPAMLFALLVYAYCQGVRSSRQIERLCGTDVAFRVLCAQDIPDHCTLARFRADAAGAFTDLFGQVLVIAAKAGLARFGTVAIDGTKIPANASIDANRGRAWFQRHAQQLTADAEATDRAEDAAAARDGEQLGDRVPPSLAEPSRRAERVRAAAAELAAQEQRKNQADRERQAGALERRRRSEQGKPVLGRIPNGPHRLAEARAHLAREVAEHQAKLDRYASITAAGGKPMGRPPVLMDDSSRVRRARAVVASALDAAERSSDHPAPAGKKLPATVANTTDPQSRIMPTRRGFLQGYNAQVAVTADQVIVAVQVGQSTTDQRCFTPMLRATEQAAAALHAITGSADQVIGTVLADAGYNSDANLAVPGPDRLIAAGKGRDQARTAAREPAHGPPPPARARGRRTDTGYAPPKGTSSTPAAAPRSSPASGTSRRSSTGSLAAAWTTPPASST